MYFLSFFCDAGYQDCALYLFLAHLCALLLPTYVSRLTYR